ncbi:MAG: hypothetical protein JXB30_02355 [Anaerolineae bacterium]|nr:hypothetical protein [Anaerolineae bacterium]
MKQFDHQEGHPLNEQDSYTQRLLGTLVPGSFDQPDARRALVEFRRNTERRGELTMTGKIKINRTVQRVLGGIAGAALLVGLVAWTPVGALASDFLSLFRVERFVVVGVDPQRVDQLVQALDQDTFFGEQEILEGGGEPVRVASLDEAIRIVGFRPKQAAKSLGEPTNILISSQTVMRFTPDIEALRTIFNEVGLDQELIPANIDGRPFDISVPAGVMLNYQDPDTLSLYSLAEMPSPTVTVPEGVDIQALGGAMLQLLGMSPQEAERMSNTIDWTTTLVVPIPTDMMSNMQEINVRSSSALMFWNDPDAEGHQAMLVWQEAGHLYVITGPGTGNILAFAEKLQ